jgi:flagellum-specific peptidoglycan hydrolase FlgJ
VTTAQLAFVQRAATAAQLSGHIWPRMAACEAGEESRYGQSLLAIQDNNLFGMKAHRHANGTIAILPTREFENGEWIEVKADFERYTSWAQCFSDRMVTISRLASMYPHYLAALRAANAETYITEVSETWSTDPNRAKTIQAIYDEVFGGPVAA